MLHWNHRISICFINSWKFNQTIANLPDTVTKINIRYDTFNQVIGKVPRKLTKLILPMNYAKSKQYLIEPVQMRQYLESPDIKCEIRYHPKSGIVIT